MIIYFLGNTSSKNDRSYEMNIKKKKFLPRYVFKYMVER